MPRKAREAEAKPGCAAASLPGLLRLSELDPTSSDRAQDACGDQTSHLAGATKTLRAQPRGCTSRNLPLASRWHMRRRCPEAAPGDGPGSRMGLHRAVPRRLRSASAQQGPPHELGRMRVLRAQKQFTTL